MSQNQYNAEIRLKKNNFGIKEKILALFGQISNNINLFDCQTCKYCYGLIFNNLIKEFCCKKRSSMEDKTEALYCNEYKFNPLYFYFAIKDLLSLAKYLIKEYILDIKKQKNKKIIITRISLIYTKQAKIGYAEYDDGEKNE